MNSKIENRKNKIEANFDTKTFDSWNDILVKNNQIKTILNLILAMMFYINIDR